ncbi:AMP-dependent synthetase/ligase [Mesobacillus zeae]|uniref:Long-chain fatty acid--CoA ligase n=1 Tax=Mesobacillus zeae TaxID=1917180 RepID=A0A398AZJ7_9BACI|nr:long-chain fatty acid--CoA ligase [Mesobacillus zeae]RID82464.1 long-chain fatty acid--CoA ligase [Mesobacillus zeae]
MNRENLLAAVYHSVLRFPDKKALMWKCGGVYQSMSYSAMWKQIRHAAAGLAGMGITSDDKVAILSENNPTWPISDLAILSLGAVSVPVYPSLPANQVEHILRNAECKAVIVQNEQQLNKVQETGMEDLIKVVMDTQSPFTHPGKVIPFYELVVTGQNNPLSGWEESWQSIDSGQLATIIHTSGTTGSPKGAMLTHGNFLSNIKAIQFWCMEAGPDDILLSYLPLSHVFERMAGQFTPLTAGATIAYAESIEAIPDNLLEVRPTIMTTVPRLLEKVYAKVQGQVAAGGTIKKKLFNWAVGTGTERYEYLANASMDEMVFGEMPRKLRRRYSVADRLVFSKVKANLGGRMRALVSGGAALNPEIAGFFWSMGIPILEGYGLTETAPVIASNPMTRPKIGTVGRVLANVDVRIAEDGEILVKGPSIMKGYYRNEEATAEQFSDGWFRTGDIGTLDDDGYLTIVDRKKRLLILSTGKNVAPQHIENAINQSSYIENSVILGHNQKYIIAVISPDQVNLRDWAERHGVEAVSRQELIQHPKVQERIEKEMKTLTVKLAPFEQPKKVIVVPDEWTVDNGSITPSLKVRYNVIEEKYKESIIAGYQQEAYLQLAESAEEGLSEG